MKFDYKKITKEVMKFDYKNMNHIKNLCLIVVTVSLFSIAMTYIIQSAKYGPKTVEALTKELKKANRKIDRLEDDCDSNSYKKRW
tara:strand:- start:197 stop:451 length:255 start_codon:yes stop_codon:yes gene_type:complete